MRLRETPSSSIVCNGHLAVLLMPISVYAGQAMPQWPPAPQAIMFGFTRWKGLIGSAHVPDWTCFTLVSLHRIKDSPSLLGTIIRTRRNTHACTGAWTCTVRNLHTQRQKRTQTEILDCCSPCPCMLSAFRQYANHLQDDPHHYH